MVSILKVTQEGLRAIKTLLSLCMGASGAWILAVLLRSGAEYKFPDVMDASLLFYEAQRSGMLPPTNRIPWRGDSGLLDRTENNRSLVGGYYDAGDTPKFGLPLAVSFSFISWGLLEFREGYTPAQAEKTLDAIKWATDYMIKCHTGVYEFYAQVGSGRDEHRVWARPEDMLWNKVRIGHKIDKDRPGSDVVGSTAAAMASASILFKRTDPRYAKTLLTHAEQLYAFGNKHRGPYSDSIADAKEFYQSSQFKDDLAWGAIWLYLATRKTMYMQEAKKHVDALIKDGVFNYMLVVDWNFVGHPACALLYKVTRDVKYSKCVEDHLDKWVYEFTRTPKGLTFVKWGFGTTSLRNNANTAMLGLVYAKDVARARKPMEKAYTYQCWALSQIRYMLGDGGRSYVVGYGINPPKRPHHRGASCPSKGKCSWENYSSKTYNPQVLTGALVGGPDVKDGYADDRSDWIQSEVALDYNAGFMSAVAGLQRIQRKSDGFGRCYTGFGWLHSSPIRGISSKSLG